MLGGSTSNGGVWNIQGLVHVYKEVVDWMKMAEMDWLVLTETKLTTKNGTTSKPLEVDNRLVSLAAGDRNKIGPRNGLALLVHPGKFATVEEIVLDNTNGQWALWRLDSLLIAGIYWAPSVSLEDGSAVLKEIARAIERTIEQTGEVEPGVTLTTVICGDFNARMQLPDGRFADNPRGITIRNWASENLWQFCQPAPDDPLQWLTTHGENDETRYGWMDLFLTSGDVEFITVSTDTSPEVSLTTDQSCSGIRALGMVLYEQLEEQCQPRDGRLQKATGKKT